jgi:hypothetical protein
MRHTLSLVVVASLYSIPAFAQPTAAAAPAAHHQTLSTNPFGLLFNWINVEYERKIAPATTLGVSASHFSELEQSNAAILLRWYPKRKALHGLYLGARAGAYRFETYEYEPYPSRPVDPTFPTYPHYPVYERRTTVVPGAGFEMGYNWLLGPEERVSIGLGFGLTRLLQNVDSDIFFVVIPNPRVVNIGIAF